MHQVIQDAFLQSGAQVGAAPTAAQWAVFLTALQGALPAVSVDATVPAQPRPAPVTDGVLEGVLSSLDDPLLILGDGAELRWFNPAAADFLGLHDVHVGQKITNIITVTDERSESDAVRTLDLAALLAGRRVQRTDRAVVELLGETVWKNVEMCLTPMRTPTPACAGVLLLRDLREQRLAAHVLQVREAMLSAIFEAAHVGIAGVGMGEQVLKSNDALQTMLDTPFEASHQLSEFVHPEDQSRFRALSTSITEQSEPLEFRLRGKDDAWFWASVGMAHIENTAIGPLKKVFIVEDISDRKRLELELRHAQKLESVGRLSSGIAHEINTPIQFVGDNTHFLGDAFNDTLTAFNALKDAIDKADDPAMQALVDKVASDADMDFLKEEVPLTIKQILEGVDRVSTIVRGMRRFAHNDHGERGPADLNAAIESTLTVARNETKYVADVELELGVLPPTPVFLSDLNQVFLNLLINAAHAIEDSGKKRGMIRVRTWADEDSVYIAFKDDGCGMPDEVRERVFDPFFTTKEVGRGTGQGLPMARAIIHDKHGGTLTCASAPGEGTTFTITLPQKAAAAAA